MSPEGCKGCAFSHRCDIEKRTRIMFRVLHPEIQTTLRNLSGDGMIYIGREGIGLSRAFSKAVLQIGTIKAIDQFSGSCGPEEIRLLELIAIEGPRWLCYQRVIDALWNAQKHEATAKPILTEVEASSQEIWAPYQRSQV